MKARRKRRKGNVQGLRVASFTMATMPQRLPTQLQLSWAGAVERPWNLMFAPFIFGCFTESENIFIGT